MDVYTGAPTDEVTALDGSENVTIYAVLYVRAVKLTARINGVNFLLALTLAATIFPEVNGSGSGETYFAKFLALARSVNFFQKVSYWLSLSF